ncbi:MAG: hypothetical protein ACKOFD_02480 [Actinomycetota bacterium]
MTSMQTQQQTMSGRATARTCEFLLPSTGLITVAPWRQASITRSCPLAECRYLEQFWLGILGPTATWLARHLSRLVMAQSEVNTSHVGITVDISELGARLGVSTQPLHDSVLSRAINRLIMFNFAAPSGSDESVLEMRTTAPRVSDRLVARMHPSLRDAHWQWVSQSVTGEPECCVPQRH